MKPTLLSTGRNGLMTQASLVQVAHPIFCLNRRPQTLKPLPTAKEMPFAHEITFAERTE